MICWFRSTGPGPKRPFAIMICWFRSTGSGAKETLCHHDLLVPVYWFRHLLVYWFRRSRFPLLSWFPSSGQETRCWFWRQRHPFPWWFLAFQYRFRRQRDPFPSWFPAFRSTGSGTTETFCHHDFLCSGLLVLALKIDTLCCHDFLVSGLLVLALKGSGA